MEARYQRRLEKLSAILLKKAADFRALIAQKEADLQELRSRKVFSSLQLDLTMKKLEELKSDVLRAQRRNEEEFSQRMKLRDQMEKLELQMQHQKQIFFQLISKDTNSGGGIEKLQSDHKESQQHIKDLETRLEKIQDNLQSKLQAVDAIQEKNASLQKEITSLRNTFGCDVRTTLSRLPSAPVQFQQTSESTGNVSSKPSTKILYSMFTQPTPTASLLPGMSPSRMVRFPVSSAVTLDKPVAPNSTSFLLQKHVPYTSFSNTDPNLLGQGQDYVRSLFADSKKTDPEEKVRRLNAPAEYLSSITSSAVGNLKIVEVHSDGHYMKILNTSPDQEESIGSHTLQQNLYGHPVLMFQFPPKIRMKAGSGITVWAACSEKPHKPPTDFLWKECKRFRCGPECTTILCNPNGQAVAWYTPINWNQKETKAEEKNERPLKNIRPPRIPQPKDNLEGRTVSVWQAKSLAEKSEPEFIMREEKTPPCLYPVQSAWCQSPNAVTHPHYSMKRRGEGRPTSTLRPAHPLQSGPPPGILYTEGSHGMKSTTGSGCEKTRTRPIRSAGPNLGGVIGIGSTAPIGSALQKYLVRSSSSCRLLAQVSLSPTLFL